MELPGHVAVIDGRLLPLAEWHVDVDHDITPIGNPGHQSTLVPSSMHVSKESVSGTMVVLGGNLPDTVGYWPIHDVYLFPKSGTRDRVFLTGVIFSSLERHGNGRIRMDFAADSIVR